MELDGPPPSNLPYPLRISIFVFQVSGLGFGQGSCLRLVLQEGFCGLRLTLASRVSGFGFRVSGFGFRVSGFGFRVSGFGFRVSGFGFRVSGLGPEVRGLGFGVVVLQGKGVFARGGECSRTPTRSSLNR
jgi:hypothetical protein